MKIIRQSWEFLNKPDADEALRLIETAGRVCYKTEGKMGPGTSPDFIRKRIATGHLSVIEHVNITVRIITDRGVTHEIVRHRLASYSQESTRYCNYSQLKFGREITVILPVWFDGLPETGYESAGLKGIGLEHIMAAQDNPYRAWELACQVAEAYYFKLLDMGQSPQRARSVLPNSLKTEMVMTCNVREWRHFLALRTHEGAHPQMKDLAQSMRAGFKEAIPVLFEDL
ncbi:MAG: Thymidylate synthase ThyX [Syntrophorhabdus sp. PtaB.Bin047]|nr:MAG: Thymidylate synthase ThyX [Syntrophorhabdus sp. PtaB.Bin047]